MEAKDRQVVGWKQQIMNGNNMFFLSKLTMLYYMFCTFCIEGNSSNSKRDGIVAAIIEIRESYYANYFTIFHDNMFIYNEWKKKSFAELLITSNVL